MKRNYYFENSRELKGRSENCMAFLFVLGVCPLLCSGKGEYKNGECDCKPGWKGKECSIRYEECEVSRTFLFKLISIITCMSL
jgi:hypothetical protein